MARYDVVIIGGGSAGYHAARLLGAEGKRIALIDRGPWGGLCILRGCMPTKAMLRSAEVAQLARHASEFGVEVGPVSVDFGRVMARQASLVRGFQDYRLEGLDSLPGTERIEGTARFVSPHAVQVGDRLVEGDRFLVTTGSRPHVPPLEGLAEVGFLTSDDAVRLQKLPRRLLVWGGGVIAVELGQFFARMGSEVTFLLRGEHVLGAEDLAVQEVVETALARDGIRLLRYASPQLVTREGESRRVVGLAEDREFMLDVDEILVATGRVPALDSLDLARAGIDVRDGRIVVDSGMRTSVPHVFAAGDALGMRDLVHVAIQQAEIAARNMLGRRPQAVHDERLLASAVFSEPQVGRVGLSASQAKRSGLPHRVARYDFADLGKAECLGSQAMQGFVQLVAHAETGEILGATCVGPEASELIHEMIVAMAFRATEAQVARMPHLHPTLSEIWTYPAEELAMARMSGNLEAAPLS
ncbi:MAG: dihydrolipoyl dehydrogenase [bacterium]|nr:dihydrolipoyl dehydrogenase [bacterium]